MNKCLIYCLPNEIENNIMSYLRKCELCKINELHNNSCICAFCKRSWCKKCCKKYNIIEKAYFEVYVECCKHCLDNIRPPKYLWI